MLSNVISPLLVIEFGIVFALWFGTILCGFSALCVGLVIAMDSTMDKRITTLKSTSNTSEYVSTPLQEEEEIKAADTPASVHVIMQSKYDSLESGDENERHSKDEVARQVSWRDVLLLPHIFWVLVLSCIVMYGSVVSFNNVSASLLLERDYFQAPPGTFSPTIPQYGHIIVTCICLQLDATF